jgi:hypothetical protein
MLDEASTPALYYFMQILLDDCRRPLISIPESHLLLVGLLTMPHPPCSMLHASLRPSISFLQSLCAHSQPSVHWLKPLSIVFVRCALCPVPCACLAPIPNLNSSICHLAILIICRDIHSLPDHPFPGHISPTPVRHQRGSGSSRFACSPAHSL